MKAKEQGKRKRIGELLIDAGLITPSQLTAALEEQKKCGKKLVELLLQMGFLTRDAFTAFIARQGVPGVKLSLYPISEKCLRLIPGELARKHEVFPLDQLGKILTLAMAFPLDKGTIDEIEKMTGLKVRPVLCSVEDVHRAIQQYYSEQDKEGEGDSKDTAVSAVDESVSAASAQETASEASGSEKKAEEKQTSSVSSPASPEPEPVVNRLANIKNLLRKIDSLPALPNVVQELGKVINSENCNNAALAEVIEKDPAISAKLLSVVNSSAYGLSHEIADITHAVGLLGLKETYNIVLSVSVMDTVLRDTSLEYESIWQDAYRCAGVAKELARKLKIDSIDPAEAFTAGLLRDIGWLALMVVANEQYSPLVDTYFGRDLIEMEEKVFSITHAEAGFFIAENWGLPSFIREPIRFHHAPGMAREFPELTALISLADTIVSADKFLQRDSVKACKILHLPPSETMRFLIELSHLFLNEV